MIPEKNIYPESEQHYLHLVDLHGKCRQIYHTRMVWDITVYETIPT